MADAMPTSFLAGEHPLRRALAGEVHARPYELVAAPVRASHLALCHGEGWDATAERAHLAALLVQHGAEPPGADATHFSRDLGALRLRFERHTEFTTYTFLRTDPFDTPFAGTALEMAPQDWLRRLPGQLMVALHLAIDGRTRSLDATRALFDGNPLVGSRIGGGRGELWTDFRLHADGCGRMLVRDSPGCRRNRPAGWSSACSRSRPIA